MLLQDLNLKALAAKLSDEDGPWDLVPYADLTRVERQALISYGLAKLVTTHRGRVLSEPRLRLLPRGKALVRRALAG